MNLKEKLFMAFVLGVVVGASASALYMRLKQEKELQEDITGHKETIKSESRGKAEEKQNLEQITESNGYSYSEDSADHKPKNVVSEVCTFLEEDVFNSITEDPRTNCEGDYTWFMQDDIIVDPDDEKVDKSFVFDDIGAFDRMDPNTECYFIYNPHRKSYYALYLEPELTYNDPEEFEDDDDPYE